jgi:pimeloyl-ACP methyl ester carboxylesterase
MNIMQGSFFSRIATRRAVPWLAVGAALATAAIVVRQQTKRVEAEHPARGQFIDVESVRLHYLERGQGRPLVLLHGNGDMAEDFALSGLLDRLASAGFRVIAFDRPGYGYSERPHDRAWTPSEQADLLHHAMLRLGIDHAIVAAHSWGTLVALHLALKYPSAVQGLMLMSGYYFPTLRFDVPQLSMPSLPVIGDLLRHTLSPLLGRVMWPLFTRRMFGPSPTHPRFADFPVWMSLRPLQLCASAAESAMMIPAARALRKRYRELTMPIVLLAGRADKHVDARLQTMRLHDALPNSELRIAPGVGHMVHYLVPEQIVSAVDALAQRVEQQSEVGQEAGQQRSRQSRSEATLNSAGTIGI